MDPALAAEFNSELRESPRRVLYGICVVGGSLTKAQWTTDRELALDIFSRETSLGKAVELWQAELTGE